MAGAPPYGIKFPWGGGEHGKAAVRIAQTAPVYREAGGYHEALFDRGQLRHLLELLDMAKRGRSDLIQHSVDGGVSWSYEWVPWACFAKQVEGGHQELDGLRCGSYWGCKYANERQDPYLTGTVYWHGRHGSFVLQPEFAAYLDSLYRPNDFRMKLEAATWGFDRPRIKQEVVKLVRHFHGHRCPAFAMSYLNQQIKRLPVYLIVNESPSWEVVIQAGTKVGVMQTHRRRVIENPPSDNVRRLEQPRKAIQ